jgi:hypothetical protein
MIDSFIRCPIHSRFVALSVTLHLPDSLHRLLVDDVFPLHPVKEQQKVLP